MDFDQLLVQLKEMPFYKDQIIYQTTLPPKEPLYRELDFRLDSVLEVWLEKTQIQLFSHQAEALNLIDKGKNVVITTPTASGKTLIFSLAVANAIAQRKRRTALFLYPTKALANDQLTKLNELNKVLDGKLKPFIYDGDTPLEDRSRIRNSAHVIISNPYAWHQYLDWHQKWDRFLRNLSFIIIDEAHTYRGVFGSNVAQLFRRLNRILAYYGSRPQYILSSATINNPESFSRRLIGSPTEIISVDGAQYGEKHIILWNPPYIDRYNIKKRSPHQETKDILKFLLKTDIQTLVFVPSRRMVEIISLWTNKEIQQENDSSIEVLAYRAGYRPSERRMIENKLRERNIQGVVSTNALEVGIDIGDLDGVILSGFPGTIISTWQQFGRAGRNLRPSLGILVLFEDALQQFLGRNPIYFMEKNPENAIIDLQNTYIMKGHILCASKELPISLTEIKEIWGEKGLQVIQELKEAKLVRIVPAGIISNTKVRPSSIVALNTAFTNIIEVIENGKLLETLTIPQAYREAHSGAILIHQGETYFIEDVDWKNGKAYAQKTDVDYYTESLSDSDVNILEVHVQKSLGIPLFYGRVKVTEIYHSYRLKSYDEVLEIRPLYLPPLEFETKALWFEIPLSIIEPILDQSLDLPGGIHALEHATIALSPIFAMCDRWDIGGVSYPIYPADRTTKIFIYDGFPGGIGISEQLFEKFSDLCADVLKLVQECSCTEGCPSCVQSPKCGNDNFPLDKKVAISLLKEINLLIVNQSDF